MSGAPEEPVVVDVPDQSRFVLEEDGDVAELTYHVNGHRLVLIHTGVPGSMEGHGVGGRLVEAAIDRAARERLVVVPRCPFARSWLDRHPEAAAKVGIDWSYAEK